MAILKTITPTTSDYYAGAAISSRHHSQKAPPHVEVTCVCVCEKEEGKPGTRIARDDVHYREATPEVQANLIYEVPFRRWLLATITTQGFYYRTDAINEGAEITGCSPQTTKRYVAKLTSQSGPISQTKDALGHIVLMLKPHLQTPPPKRSQRQR